MSIPLVKVPRYQMTLPFTKKVVDYRPFLVKEEKLLIMAKDSGDREMIIRTVGDVVRDCTEGVVDADTSPMFDVQYAFLAIRGKSVGEEIEYFLVCGKCGHRTTAVTRIDDFKLIVNESHSPNVPIDEEVRLLMKYPTLHHFNIMFGETENDENVDAIVIDCVDSIITKDEVIKTKADNRQDVQTFIEGLLPTQYDKVESFFATMPLLQCSKEYQCERCGTDNDVAIGGINNFFV